MPQKDSNVLEAKKTTFSSRFGMSLFRFLFPSKLGSLHAHKKWGTLRKTSISTRVYAEIHIHRPVFYNNKSI
jgi:hypothetical protein